MIQIRLWALVSEHVLKMVRAKRATILPLRVAEAIAFADRDPTMAADRLPRAGVGLTEPWDHEWSFRFKLAVRDVVIRQREVKRILPRDERNWNVIPTRTRLRVVRAAVIRRPIQIPRTL